MKSRPELSITKQRRASEIDQIRQHRLTLQDNAKGALRTPELIRDYLLQSYPNELPIDPCVDWARLQGQQDVIRYLSGLIKTANGETD